MPIERARWLDAEINKLLDCIRNNLHCTIIAEHLERSESSVYSFCFRNNITLPRKAAVNAGI